MRYAKDCPAPKVLVRRATAEAMVEHAKLVKQWIDAGQLAPVNPGDDTPLYDPEDIRTLALAMKHNSRKFRTEAAL